MTRSIDVIFLDHTAQMPMEPQAWRRFVKRKACLYAVPARVTARAGRPTWPWLRQRRRQEDKQLLKRLERDSGKAEESAYSAIHMLLLDAYPGWKKDGAAPSSSETCDISAPVIERGENDDAY